MITILFIKLNKSLNSSNIILNYFILQESLGLVFLFSYFLFFQFFVLCFKVGVAPFHFWLFSVLSGVYDFGLLWFLTFQKAPYIFCFFYLFSFDVFYFLFFGIFFCYLQVFLLKNYKNIVFISSVESFNWILLLVFFSFCSSLLLFFIYIFLMSVLLFKVYYYSYGSGSWESVFVFLNIPLTVTFFVKIFSLGVIFSGFFILNVVLFIIFLSSLSFCYWLVFLRTSFYSYSKFENYVFLCFWLIFTFFCLFYHFNII